MLIYLIYAAIAVFNILSIQLYRSLPLKTGLERILIYLTCTLFLHNFFAAIFRDFISGYRYVDVGAPFGLLYGPYLYYGYLTLKGKKIHRRIIFTHSLPFIIAALFYLVFLSMEPFRLNYGKYYYVGLYSSFGLSWIIYPLVVLIKGNISDILNLEMKRLYYYFIVMLLILAAIIIPSIMSTLVDDHANKTPLSGNIIYVIMLVGSALIYEYYLQSLKKFMHRGSSGLLGSNSRKSLLPPKRTESLNPAVHSPFQSKILSYLEDKVYLDPDFTVDRMVKDMKIPRPVIVQFFREFFKKNVLKTINTLRIEEVCSELIKKDFDMNIDELALRCGFSSRASFYRNFNNEKQCSPIEYREKHLAKIASS